MIMNTAIILLLARVPAISAHMGMKFPPPLNYELNPHRNTSKPIDKSYNDPLKADGSDFPCRGYAGLMDTRGGAEVATYNAGETGYLCKILNAPAIGVRLSRASLGPAQSAAWTMSKGSTLRSLRRRGCDSPTWSTGDGVDRYTDTMFPDPGRVVELVLPKGNNC